MSAAAEYSALDPACPWKPGFVNVFQPDRRAEPPCARVHLVKLCVGANSVNSLAEWQAGRTQSGVWKTPEHITRMRPRRAVEILNGGSLYWVIRGLILARQRILALDSREGDDGITRCAIVLDAKIIRTKASPRRAFQGWRYLDPAAAPDDLTAVSVRDDALPHHIEAQLDRFGVV